MDENTALRRENDSLREQNQELLRRAVGAEDVMAALARGEVDAVTVEAIDTPLLLHAAQDDLRRSKALMRAVFDGSFDAKLLSDDSGRYVDANPAACELFGLPRERLVGRSLADFAEPGYDGETSARSLREQGRVRGRFPLRRLDGSRRVLDYSALANVAPGLHLSVLRDVTSQVDAENELRASRTRLEEAQAIAHVGSWTSGLAPHGIIHWSAEGARIVGVPAGAHLPVSSFLEMAHPEDRERVERTTRDAVDHDAPHDVEYRIVRPDGFVRWVHQRGVVERDSDGQAVELVGTIQDVTDRHLAVEALRTSEAEFRLLAEAMPQVVWITLPDGSNVYFNQRWMDYTGLTLEESLGDGWLRPFHPDDAHAAREAWRTATSSAGGYSIECRLRRADGIYCWWLIRGVPVFDASDNLLKWFGTCTDVNDLKLGEARLRESEAMLRFTGHAARLGGWHVSIPDARLTWSDEVCRIHELPAGSSPSVEQAIAFYAPEFRQTIREKFEACVREGVSFDVELQIITSTGRRVWVRALGDAERSSTGAVTMVRGAFQDIDDRRKLQEQYRQAQKMEAIGRLAGGVAHDFNNALSVILSYSEMIVGDLDPGDPMRDDVEEIRKAGVRAAAFTHQLLIFSRRRRLCGADELHPAGAGDREA